MLDANEIQKEEMKTVTCTFSRDTNESGQSSDEKPCAACDYTDNGWCSCKCHKRTGLKMSGLDVAICKDVPMGGVGIPMPHNKIGE
ncbi:hypothetical protein HWB51_gp087 [Mycobacterium phage Cuke]|uniref:Uncharacterized protein n=1 Tax=Mycobacterium phage Cuke TaxID=2079417 RepID=A0A2L1IX41_9CAUD|nr:hypothetical protein HWB51_gp087 [Mycobacterium phage Cuke]AVD99725.1 hypothetical protein SEA_CUKE_109 [Mycobacterium phage Cuke]